MTLNGNLSEWRCLGCIVCCARATVGRGLQIVRLIQAEQIQRGNCYSSAWIEEYGKPIVWVFPEILVCLDCGIADCAVPEAQVNLKRATPLRLDSRIALRDLTETWRLHLG